METTNRKMVMFCGFSGSGKTTLAKQLTELQNPYRFISGSMSDLIKPTKDESHSDMLSRDKNTLQLQDYQLLNLRSKLFKEATEDLIVSDRSFIDNAAYYIYKQAATAPECEINQFISICKQCLALYCTHLIYIPYTTYTYHLWVIEDNNKRILNRYFQWNISQIMQLVIQKFGYTKVNTIEFIQQGLFKFPEELKYGAEVGIINSIYGNTRVLILKELNIDTRMKLINLFLDGKI